MTFLDIEDSGATRTKITLESDSPDTAYLILETPDPADDSQTIEASSHIGVYDAILLREALDSFIENAVGVAV